MIPEQEIKFRISLADIFEFTTLKDLSDDMHLLSIRTFRPGIGYVYVDGQSTCTNKENPAYLVRCYGSVDNWIEESNPGKNALETLEITRNELRSKF